jgi:hypothetical protein
LFRQQFSASGLLLAGDRLQFSAKEIRMMLSVQECVDMSELSNEAIRGIAEHEHIPEVVAAELGQELLKTTGGIAEIQRILEENLELAVQAGEQGKISDRKRLLKWFNATYRK